jgi:hypothetical protein
MGEQHDDQTAHRDRLDSPTTIAMGSRPSAGVPREVVPRIVEVEVAVPRLDACRVVGVGLLPRSSTKKGTAVTNNYQNSLHPASAQVAQERLRQ